MSTEDRDPLLEKLSALPVHTLHSKRAAETLKMAEAALPRKVRPGLRWPEFAIAVTLSVTGIMYTLDSVHKLSHIYGSNQETAANHVR